LVAVLLDNLSRLTPAVDFRALVSLPLPVLVICELLGVPYADRAEFRRWSDDAADMLDGPRSRAGLAQLQAYMSELLERKRRALPKTSSLIWSRHRRTHAPRSLTKSVAQLAAGLLFAGHETTVTAIDKGVILLLTNPAERDLLQRDPTVVSRVAEEMLRMPMPLPAPEHVASPGGLPRYANAGIEVGGATIAAGDLVLLNLEHANLDSAVFARPDAFEAERTDNPHRTFGHGAH
jgi:pentalenolactone synthase